MLTSIYLNNFAIIDEQTISFKNGFNVLSGETGAGKSILINALGLQLGDRADSSWVKNQNNRCEIQSFFDIQSTTHPNVNQWLEYNEYDDESQCFLRRILKADGKSKCYINGIPTTLGQTKQLGEMLVNIHGQHSHQDLTDTKGQLHLLDQFGQYEKSLKNTQTAFSTWQKKLKEKQALSESQNLKDQLELLSYQLSEIEQLSPQVDEFEYLESQQKALNSATENLIKLNQINQIIENDDVSLNQLMSQLTHLSEELQNNLPENSYLIEANNLIQQANIYIEEVQQSIDKVQQSIEVNPEKLSEVELRMQIFYDLSRKHQCTANELPKRQIEIYERIEQLTQAGEKIKVIDDEINQAEKYYFDCAKQLSNQRTHAAQKLVLAVKTQLSALNLDCADFCINITPSKHPKKEGIDDIEFTFSANPGQPLKPLNKIASGGELSRISLAIQVAGTKEVQNKTLIFDEVDSGVGGATAEKIGQLLKQLAQYNQVICITHLAQVAAFSDHHIKIEKNVKANQTDTQFHILDEKQIIDELARMSGGVELNEKTLEHAKNIRDNAIQFMR